MTYYSYIILGAMATTTDLYIDYELPVGITNLQCNGNENTIWNCSYDITLVLVRRCYTEASVFCMCMLCLLYSIFYMILIIASITEYVNCTDGDIRLVGGTSGNEGNVQICYNNAWGSVCDDSWDTSDTNVVCRQLGLLPYGIYPFIVLIFIVTCVHVGSQSFYSNYFQVYNSPSFVYGHFYCYGSEQFLVDCPQSSPRYLLYCSSYEIAGVRCVGEWGYISKHMLFTLSHKLFTRAENQIIT